MSRDKFSGMTEAIVNQAIEPSGKAGIPPDTAAEVNVSGLLCLAFVAGHYQVSADLFQMIHDVGPKSANCDSDDLMRMASRLGFKTRLQRQQDAERLQHILVTSLLRLENGLFVVLALRLSDGSLRIFEPQKKAIVDLPKGQAPRFVVG